MPSSVEHLVPISTIKPIRYIYGLPEQKYPIEPKENRLVPLWTEKFLIRNDILLMRGKISEVNVIVKPKLYINSIPVILRVMLDLQVLEVLEVQTRRVLRLCTSMTNKQQPRNHQVKRFSL